ncbi:MAG: D-alanine-D-alanine ligase [Rhodothermales bacterium]|jgi:D-alanine-D-alanine ligase
MSVPPQFGKGSAAHGVRRVGVFFGGISPEHEVSIISALQAMAALDKHKWLPVPIYVTKSGVWWTGDSLRDPAVFKQPLVESNRAFRVNPKPGAGRGLVLEASGPSAWYARSRPAVRVDVVLPIMHGGAGEDGSLQGLFETLSVPYAGSGPLAAALAMDKVAAKRWAAGYDIPQAFFYAFNEASWQGSEEAMLDRLIETVGLPCIVKPASLGSSIGIARAETRAELNAAVEDAMRYDASVVVEEAVANLRELNCSVLGRKGNARASVLEEPLSGEALLSFQDKYMRGGGAGKGKGQPGVPLGKAPAAGMASLDRQIPAAVSDALTDDVRALAVRVFEVFDCQGVVRIDFLMDGTTGRVLFNEINTMPGSLSFYLWEPSGVPFAALLTEVIEAGLARHRENAGRIRSYDVNLLSARDLGGLKGAKG